MMTNPYYGNSYQIYGAEESRLVGGKGDGMRMLTVRNGLGLEFMISLDRAGDIARLQNKGVNYGFFGPCGFVAPAFYDLEGIGFLKSFTAGFFTTCGLTCVGSPCEDEGEILPLHGTLSNIPCERYNVEDDGSALIITVFVRDAALFGHQLMLKRVYRVSLTENTLDLTDTVENIGPTATPLQVLYHCNFGYPLLTENSELSIPSLAVAPRNDHAAEGIADWKKTEKPQKDYEEMCFYHTLPEQAEVTLKNPALGAGVTMRFSTRDLPCFTQWKMMGQGQYVMGLEPGNCLPDGRNVMREKGLLEMIEPGAERTFRLSFAFH